jgi:hypothetical protein
MKKKLKNMCLMALMMGINIAQAAKAQIQK